MKWCDRKLYAQQKPPNIGCSRPRLRRVLAVAARAFSTLVIEVGCAAGGAAAEPYRWAAPS